MGVEKVLLLGEVLPNFFLSKSAYITRKHAILITPLSGGSEK